MQKKFISYKRENESFALRLRNQLEEWGYPTWMDLFDIPKGGYWPDEIDQGLRESDTVIGVISSIAIESRNVKNEWDWAIVNNKRLILLMYEESSIPVNYVSINYINCVGDAEQSGFAQLQKALKQSKGIDYRTPDPYQPYLKQLFDRINNYLGKKLISSLRDNEGTPEPIRLEGDYTPQAVEALHAKRNNIDPLFMIGGIDTEEPEETFAEFQNAFNYYDQRVLLLGDPGAGKTITLLHIGRDAVVRRIQDSTQPIPVLGIIPTWDSEKHQSITQWLAESYGTPENIESLVASGQALLLLDGLDELGSNRQRTVKNEDGKETIQIYDPRAEFIQQLPDNTQILLTCRKQEYSELQNKVTLNGAITLKTLSDAQIGQYLSQQPELLDAIHGDGTLLDMLRTPLLLSFFAFAYQNMTPENRKQLHEFDNAVELRNRIFDHFVSARYDHETRKLHSKPILSLDEIYELLGHICGENYDIRDDRIQRDKLITSNNVSTQDIISFLTKLHLLIVDDNEDTIRFSHLLIREYFTFFYWKTQLEADSDALFNLLAQKSNLGNGLITTFAHLGTYFLPTLIDILNRNLSEDQSWWGLPYLRHNVYMSIAEMSQTIGAHRTEAVLSQYNVKRNREIWVVLRGRSFNNDFESILSMEGINDIITPFIGDLWEEQAVDKWINLLNLFQSEHWHFDTPRFWIFEKLSTGFNTIMPFVYELKNSVLCQNMSEANYKIVTILTPDIIFHEDKHFLNDFDMTFTLLDISSETILELQKSAKQILNDKRSRSN